MIIRAKKNLEKSASLYADHAENKVSNLQQAYLWKYQSQRYENFANVSPRSQASEPSDEGRADVTHGFQLGLRDHPFALALEDDCREAVAGLNVCRSFRAEILRDGYDVSDILCYDIIIAVSILPMQLLEEILFAPTIKEVLVKYMDTMMSVVLCPYGIYQNLTWHAAKHAQCIMASQRVLRQTSRMPWTEEIRRI